MKLVIDLVNTLKAVEIIAELDVMIPCLQQTSGNIPTKYLVMCMMPHICFTSSGTIHPDTNHVIMANFNKHFVNVPEKNSVFMVLYDSIFKDLSDIVKRASSHIAKDKGGNYELLVETANVGTSFTYGKRQ